MAANAKMLATSSFFRFVHIKLGIWTWINISAELFPQAKMLHSFLLPRSDSCPFHGGFGLMFHGDIYILLNK